MKAEKKAADTKTAKTTDTKKAEPAKGDAMKADPAKEKTAAKPKSDEKAKDAAKPYERKEVAAEQFRSNSLPATQRAKGQIISQINRGRGRPRFHPICSICAENPLKL